MYFLYPKKFNPSYIKKCINDGNATFTKQDFMFVCVDSLYFDSYESQGTTINTARAKLKIKNKKVWSYDVYLEDVTTIQELQTNIKKIIF